MPKYRFICSSCEREILIRKSSSTKTIKCACGADMDRQMPRLNDTTTTETVDPYMGVKWQQDQREQLKARKEDHFWRHEVPRLVSSGKYELATLIENGWVTITDDGKIEIQDKPPSKR